MSKRRGNPQPASLRAEWRRLGWAPLFFAVCVAGVAVLAAAGIYH